MSIYLPFEFRDEILHHPARTYSDGLPVHDVTLTVEKAGPETVIEKMRVLVRDGIEVVKILGAAALDEIDHVLYARPALAFTEAGMMGAPSRPNRDASGWNPAPAGEMVYPLTLGS